MRHVPGGRSVAELRRVGLDDLFIFDWLRHDLGLTDDEADQALAAAADHGRG